MYQLPSGDFSPQFMKPRASVAPRFGVFIAIWVLVALAYGGYRFFVTRRADTPVRAVATARGATGATLAVWRSQARDAATAAQQAERDLRQAESEIRKTIGLTDSLVEGRHLHAALAKIEAAHEGLERTRYNMDSLETLLKGEEKQ